MFEKRGIISWLTRPGVLAGGLYLYGKPLLATVALGATGIGLAHLLNAGKGYTNKDLQPESLRRLETLAAYSKATKELESLKKKLRNLKKKRSGEEDEDDNNDVYSDRIIL